MNIRMIPPDGGSTLSVNGRTYTCAANSYLDVPDFDSIQLTANGWVMVAGGGGVGATSARPTTRLGKQVEFFDTTLGYTIVWNGAHWINPLNGNTV